MKKFLAACGIALALLAVGPERQALAYDYCGSLVPAHTWCWSPWIADENLVTWNRARYPGSGSVGVGIIFYHTFTHSYSCRHYGTNYVSATCYVRGVNGGVANTSDNRHTIEGRMNICWGCSSSLETGEPPPPGHPSASTAQQIADTEFNLDSARASLAVVDDAGASWFVVPGERTCLFRELATGAPESATCSTPEQIEEGSAYLMTDSTDDLAPGQVRIAGLAPDGATSARIQLDAASAAALVPVVNGVFVTELTGAADHRPASVEFAFAAEDEPADGETAGCQVGAGTTGGAAAILLALCGLLVRRRRRTRRA
jgi:hypothetical protein